MAEYVRLRSPPEHGQTLQLPPIADGLGIFKSNQEVLSKYPSELQSIRDVARLELPKMAQLYGLQYSDIPDFEEPDSIVMAGHQPTLFHPGVWFKNFALGSMSHSCRAMAINLVVDNDLCNNTSVLCPQVEAGTARLQRVPFDAPRAAVPFEMRAIKDRATVSSFGQRLAASICDVVDAPMVDKLWPEVMAVVQHLNLPASIAAGRHRLELNEGLQNLELPVSRMSASHSFAMFVERIVVESKRFADVYNNCLAEYRRVHRIRSRSHPVPELETDGPWQEIPFWIWTTASPNRRRLFSNRKAEVIELTDRAGWSVTLNQNGFADSLQELNQLDTDVFIRPRALATTMFSRLFASDLFLHGIGGAKYDQLNDEVMKAFFEIQPPAFMTMSATMKLPFEFDDVSKQNVTQLEAQLRQLRYHPEFHVADGEAANRKGNLIENPPMSGSRKAWRDEIAALNEKLFESLTVQRQKLETEITEATSSLPTSKILGSREFSFALFPKSLIAQLQAMSA